MGKLALLCAAALLPLSLTSAWAQTENARVPPAPGSVSAVPTYSVEPPNRLVGHTAWDDDYLYIAIQINKPTLHGSNTAPFSNPLADDAMIVTIQTDDDHKSDRPTARTVIVAASSAGGAQFYSGADRTPLFPSFDAFTNQLQDILMNEKDPDKREARRAALTARLLKFQVTPQGLRRSTGTYVSGYTAEIAVPWADLGGKPEVGTHMGFNVVAQSTTPDSPALQSLAPLVKTADDIFRPQLWDEIVFGTDGAPFHDGVVLCPRADTVHPVIDGEVSDNEWNALAAFSIEPVAEIPGSGAVVTLKARTRPEFDLKPARPVVPLPSGTSVPTLTPHRPQPLSHFVIARYEYGFQADSRKIAPAGGVTRSDGGSALTHHPFEGTGPWFSYDRADWHRQQLENARQANVDVLLPVYRGSASDRRAYADKGLIVLAASLKSLRDAGQDYPQIGLYLDASSLNGASTVSGPMLYDLIRDFYRHIPAPFRFVVPLSAQNGGRLACPVFLSGADAYTGLDADGMSYLRSHFAQDFDGADLLILGTADFKPKAALDGYFAETGTKGFQMIDGGWIKTASVGPGDEASPEQEGAVSYRSRRNGEAYRDDWMAAVARRPDWVLLDGWNDYATASEIAPSMENGYIASDITREYSRRWLGLEHRSVKLLWHNAPGQMIAGQTYAVEARAQNAGIESWGQPPIATLTVAFAYRWMRGDQQVGSGIASPLTKLTIAGQNVTDTLQVRAATADGSPLPPGNYLLAIGAVPIDKTGRREAPLGEIDAAVSVVAPGGAQDMAATVTHSDLPTMMEAGSVYGVHATLRNDGARAWHKAEGARVTLRLYRTVPGREAGSLIETPVSAADATALLEQDVAPGQTVSVSLQLPLSEPGGNALAVWRQGDPWNYTARWEVADDRGGVTVDPITVALVNFDFGARFVTATIPASLPAERRLPIRMSLRNDGPQTWVHDAVKVGYHWYYMDGSEYTFEDETTPLAKDVPPGATTDQLLAWVTPPAYDGLYFLVWDLKVGDVWASTTDSSRTFDEIVQPVRVIDGHLSFADLSTSYNLDGVSDDDAPADGDFDGSGHTFPAAFIPPCALDAHEPDAIWLPGALSGPESQRRISFRLGPKDLKEKNFIACLGQRILLGKAATNCTKLHIVAASTGKNITTSIKLVFQEPTEQSEDLYGFTVSRWDQPAEHLDQVAFMARRHNGSQGAQPGAVALYHYTLAIREPRKLVAIELPNEPAIKIAAITIEK